MRIHDRIAKFVYLQAWPLLLSGLYAGFAVWFFVALHAEYESAFRNYTHYGGIPGEFPWRLFLEVFQGLIFSGSILMLLAGWIFPFGKRPRSSLRGTGVLHRSRRTHLSRIQRALYRTMSLLTFACGAALLLSLAPHLAGYSPYALSVYYREYEFFPGLALLWLSWVVYPYEGQWDADSERQPDLSAVSS